MDMPSRRLKLRGEATFRVAYKSRPLLINKRIPGQLGWGILLFISKGFFSSVVLKQSSNVLKNVVFVFFR